MMFRFLFMIVVPNEHSKPYVDCRKCNYFIHDKNTNTNSCQLFPTFENIDMYMKTQNINNIPHEYYSCETAFINENMCNGKKFSEIVKKSNK